MIALLVWQYRRRWQRPWVALSYSEVQYCAAPTVAHLGQLVHLLPPWRAVNGAINANIFLFVKNGACTMEQQPFTIRLITLSSNRT